MNIVVKPHHCNLCYCRPDTTCEKESRDIYIPEGVNKVLWAPVVFAKVCKAGKCVSPKFVTRYYDTIGFGALTYSDDENIAFSSCMDHSSLLPSQTFGSEVFESEEEILISTSADSVNIKIDMNMKTALEETICKASERISLRIGDIIAVELSELRDLAERSESEIKFKAEYKGHCLFDLKVIF